MQPWRPEVSVYSRDAGSGLEHSRPDSSWGRESISTVVEALFSPLSALALSRKPGEGSPSV